MLFPQLERVHVEGIERLAGRVVITAAAVGREGRCPGCGTSSTRVHSRYRRRVADAPIGGTPVAITLGVRRLFCDAPDCPKRTFAEQIPGLTCRYARRSVGLGRMLAAAGLALAGRAAGRLGARGRLTDPASVRDRLTVLDQLAHTALSDMRELIYELHPSILHTEGLVAALRREAESITAREGLRVRISAPEERLTLDTSVELDLYRLAKEALHNAVKHADPSTVEVEVGECPAGSGTLVVEVVDDGVGFDPRARSAGLGLISMRERAAEVGGQLTLTSRSGGGTRIRVVAPGVLRGTATEEARW